jgi:C4-dicarboxylate-specific signal transduction histidine kinase
MRKNWNPLGQLAAGIAHEINTPTQYVGNNVGFLEDAFKETLEVLAAHDAIFIAINPTTQFNVFGQLRIFVSACETDRRDGFEVESIR